MDKYLPPSLENFVPASLSTSVIEGGAYCWPGDGGDDGDVRSLEACGQHRRHHQEKRADNRGESSRFDRTCDTVAAGALLT